MIDLNQKFLRVSDVQKRLGVSKNRAYEIVGMKTFPKITIGKRFYIMPEEYEKWEKENLRNRIIL